MLRSTRVCSARLAVFLAVLGGAEFIHAQTSPITKTGALTVTLNNVATVATGTDGIPIDLTFAPGDASRVFVATRNGDIRILSARGAFSPRLF